MYCTTKKRIYLLEMVQSTYYFTTLLPILRPPSFYNLFSIQSSDPNVTFIILSHDFLRIFLQTFSIFFSEKNPVISHTRSEKNVSSSLIYGSIAWKIWSQSKVQIYKKEMSCYIHIVTYSIRYIKYEQVGIHTFYVISYSYLSFTRVPT